MVTGEYVLPVETAVGEDVGHVYSYMSFILRITL